PAQPALEHSLRLAVPAVNARHQILWPGRGAFFFTISLPAGLAGSLLHRAHMDHRAARFPSFASIETVSTARLELSGYFHHSVHASRQELLSRADVSHAAGSGSGADRDRHRRSQACSVAAL